MAHPLEEAQTDKSGLLGKYIHMGSRGKSVTKPGRERIPTEFEPGLEDEILLDNMEQQGITPEGLSLPEHRVKHEKPIHTIMLYMFGQGMSCKDIFVELGGQWIKGVGAVSGTGQYSYAWITQIRRQPWFQQKLNSVLAKQGGDLIAERLKAIAPDAIDTQYGIMMNEEAPASARNAAASSLLDRHLGKPTQHVITEKAQTMSDLEEEQKKIDRELAIVNDQLKHLGAGKVLDAEVIEETE